MFIDTSHWKADHPGWTFSGSDASYKLTPGDNSSRLSSGLLPIGENRTISVCADILGGYGILYIRGYTPDGRALRTESIGARGAIARVSATFDDQYDRYELILGAFPDRDPHSPDHGLVDPNQVITFRRVSYGDTPIAGQVNPPPPPPPVEETFYMRWYRKFLERRKSRLGY